MKNIILTNSLKNYKTCKLSMLIVCSMIFCSSAMASAIDPVQSEKKVTEAVTLLPESKLITGSVDNQNPITLAVTISSKNVNMGPTLNQRLLVSENVSATFDFNLPRQLVPSAIEKSIDEAVQEELYWDHDKFGPQKGTASLYGGLFNRRRTTSGERHDASLATAAHKKLPFGTEVKVTNMDPGSDYGKSVVVRINDRGPFVRGRIIDLSRSAAKRIGLTISKGISRVKLEVLKPMNKNDMKSPVLTTPNIVASANQVQSVTQNVNIK